MAESFKFDQEHFDETQKIYTGILVALGVPNPNEVIKAFSELPAEKRHGTMFNAWLENYLGKDNRKSLAKQAFERLGTEEGRVSYATEMEELGLDSEISPYVKAYLAEMSSAYIPYDTVLTAGIMVGSGVSLQMGCGEGKTGVLSMASYGILQDPNAQVFLTSSTPVLAAEALDKLEFYETVGMHDKIVLITPDGIVTPRFDENGKIGRVPNSKGKMVCDTEKKNFSDMTPEQKKQALADAYSYPLVVSDNATLMQHAMDGFLPTPEEGITRRLLADEADFVLLDSYRPMQKKEDAIVDRTADRFVAYDILQRVKDSLGDSKCFVHDDSTQYVDFTKEGRAAVVAMIEATYGNRLGVEKNEVFDFVYDALVVDTVYKENRDYQILDNGKKIVSEDRASGVGIDLPEGVKQALEIKLQREGKYTGEISPEHRVSDVINVQSFFKEFFNKYQFISGTLGIDSQEITNEFFENFNIDVLAGDVYEIPPKAEGLRQDKGKTFFATQDAKRKVIIENALVEMKKGRPVLIGTVSEEEINALMEELKTQGYDKMPLIYTAASSENYLKDLKNLSNEEFQVKYGIAIDKAPKTFEKFIKEVPAQSKEKGEQGTLILGTSIIGRGTTIKADDINEIGGIHVIIDGLHETSSRNQEQYKARTARGSNKGTTQEFFAIQDIPETTRKALGIREDLTQEELEQMNPDELYESIYKNIDSRTASVRKYVVEFTEATRTELENVGKEEALGNVEKVEVAALITARAFSIRNRACGVSHEFDTEQYRKEIRALSEMYVQRYREGNQPDFDEKAWLEENGYGDIAKTYMPFSKEREEQIFTMTGLRSQAETVREEVLKEGATQISREVREKEANIRNNEPNEQDLGK